MLDIFKQITSSRRYPPGPTGHPVLGNVMALQRNMMTFLVDTARTYGSASRIRILPRWYGYIFTHPDHYKHVLVTRNQIYDKATREFALLSAMIGNSVVTSNGRYWRQQRRLALPGLRRDKVSGFARVMVARTEAMLEDWERRAAAGREVDVESEMTRLTVGIAGQTLLGEDLGDRTQRIGQLFTEANRYIAARFVRPLAPWSIHLPRPWNAPFHRILDELDGALLALIRRRRYATGPEPSDLLDAFLLARDEATGAPLSDEQVRDEAITYLFAGHETGSTALTWIFYALSSAPDIEQRLDDELGSVLGGRSPTFADLPQLRYTKMIFEEALRVYPPGYVMSRRATADDEIDGYFIPRNTQVFLSPYVTHHDPAFWDRPERFEPERFEPERARGRHPFAYIPFGFGPRRCIGDGFASAEVPLILATIAQRFRLRLRPGYRVEVVPLVTIRPRHGMPMRPVRRAGG